MTPNKVTPLSFDFGGNALRPDYVVKCSYGNDSIALLQFLNEYNQKHPLGKVVVLYNDTGWATKWWPARVDNAEKNLVLKFGFIPCRTQSVGMEKAVWNHNGWPDELRKFCTEELKIIPTHGWLREHDPEGKAVMVCGVRREESHKRRLWPEWVESSEMDEGRSSWSPLVFHTKQERDELIVRAGWEPLPHRSRECRCINANSTDLKTWSDDDIADVERIEKIMSQANPGKIKFMFSPASKKGRPSGIRAVVEWAHRVKKPEQSDVGCDSGYCSG
jgi:hypothetical protein